MTVPSDQTPFTSPVTPGTAEPGSEHDPERAEAYAESVGVDPTPEQIDAYLALEGEPGLAEQAETATERAGEA